MSADPPQQLTSGVVYDPQLKCWVACWVDERGQQRETAYSVEYFSDLGAREMAAARHQMAIESMAAAVKAHTKAGCSGGAGGVEMGVPTAQGAKAHGAQVGGGSYGSVGPLVQPMQGGSTSKGYQVIGTIQSAESPTQSKKAPAAVGASMPLGVEGSSSLVEDRGVWYDKRTASWCASWTQDGEEQVAFYHVPTYTFWGAYQRAVQRRDEAVKS
ncbi:unnamed protein product [Vitrella brassicaformis CCMP3155]|uniref:Uncharacterized protein n=2 Tax=Vitrella brassicaformis TaxID=1169539 RepID=A0A0G4G8E0_VITBC|nr:unnamed protein product [Vitrella brassicaformis CCMP3155]|eukprot:CEM25100.1 unnamed protein product [Vitrella brassicaformis CCMP3155]